MTGLILGLAGHRRRHPGRDGLWLAGHGPAVLRVHPGTPDDGLIVALTFMFTLVYVIARMVLEVLYVFLDPRVRYAS